jgi:hypothetical protein
VRMRRPRWPFAESDEGAGPGKPMSAAHHRRLGCVVWAHKPREGSLRCATAVVCAHKRPADSPRRATAVVCAHKRPADSPRCATAGVWAHKRPADAPRRARAVFPEHKRADLQTCFGSFIRGVFDLTLHKVPADVGDLEDLQELSRRSTRGRPMWRGSRRRPGLRPSCRAGTLYGGPGARALKRR